MMNSFIDLELAISDLTRRFANMLREGVISEVDHEHGLARVKSGELLTDWLPYFVRRAGSNLIVGESPDVGEQCLVLSPGGELGSGKILVGLYSNDHPQPSKKKSVTIHIFGDGLEFIHDQASHQLSLRKDGDFFVKVKSKSISFETEKAEIKNDSGELISLLSQAIDIISSSKTTTMMGPQPSLENQGKLPAIKTKIDSFKP